MKVPLLDLRRQHRGIQREINAALARVFRAQSFVLGETVERFEAVLARLAGMPYAVGMASGSDALYLALQGLGVKPGDKVITTAFSFFATAGAVTRLGAVPVFVDIGPRTFNIDGARLWEKVMAMRRGEAERVKVIMPVHLYGQCADMRPIWEVAKRFQWAVLEDAAQAVGARYLERPAGSLGDAAAFSFYPTKNLGAAGDAGAVAVRSKALAERLRRLRNHGMQGSYRHTEIGINSRLDALQAALLEVKARHLEAWNEARRRAAGRYDQLLAGLPDVRTPVSAQAGRHVYHLYVIRAKSRDALQAYLRARGVETRVYYPLPLPYQPCYRDLGHRRGEFPVAESAAREVLAIPLYPEISPKAQEYAARCIASFYGRKSS
jgi:dTDP-4-amino-4,6-dideoxygalactose transaminase